MDTLYTHTSIRTFSSKQVDDTTLTRIIEGASRASNTGNMQLYSIVATRNPEKKEELCTRAHFNQNMVRQAPVILTFCADLHRFSTWCKLRNAEPEYNNFLSFYTASIDAVIAAQNACIAAEYLGLGICYLGTTNYCADAIIEILELPHLVVPVTTIALGYPDEKPELTDRLPHRGILHTETYQTYSKEEIHELYSYKETSEIYKKFVTDSNVSNLAQVFTKKRYTGENNKLFSKKLLETIKKQGFTINF